MDSSNTKPWYASQTIIALGVSVVAKGVAVWLNWEIPEEQVANLTSSLVLIGSFVADGIAAHGRMKAKKKIG